MRDASGIERDVVVDENPKSATFGQTIKKTGVTRAQLPDRAAGRAAKKDAEKTIEDHADTVMQMSGNDPDKALAMITADKNVPARYKAAIRNRNRELARPGRPAKKPSALPMLGQQPANQVEAPQQ